MGCDAGGGASAQSGTKGRVVVTCSSCPSGQAADRYVVYSRGLHIELPREPPKLPPEAARILLEILMDVYKEKQAP